MCPLRITAVPLMPTSWRAAVGLARLGVEERRNKRRDVPFQQADDAILTVLVQVVNAPSPLPVELGA